MTAVAVLIAEEARASTAAVCRALNIPRSSLYARRNR